MNATATNRLHDKLMLPTNWDPALLPRLRAFRPAYVYGSLPAETTLRNSANLPTVTEDARPLPSNDTFGRNTPQPFKASETKRKRALSSMAFPVGQSRKNPFKVFHRLKHKHGRLRRH